MRTFLILALTSSLAVYTAAAQSNDPSSVDSSSQSSLPSLPQPQKPSPQKAQPNDSYLYRAGVLCGTGATTSSVASKPTVGCGAGFTFVPLPIFVEVGVMGPQANRSSVSGYVSVDGSLPLAPVRSPYLPMAILGYSRLFETGHALDYGIALAMPNSRRHPDGSRSLRIELRDYWTFANPSQHNILLRFGWMSIVTD